MIYTAQSRKARSPGAAKEALMLGRLLRDEEGMASVEYAILLAVLVITSWVMWRFFAYRMRRPLRRLVRRWPTAP